MRGEFSKAVGGFCDRRAVRGVKPTRGQGAQAVQRGHIGAHIAVGRRDQRRCPTHHVIAAKDHVIEHKAQMIAEMPRCMDRSKAPIPTGDPCAVGKDDIRAEILIDAFTSSNIAPRSQRVHRRTPSGVRAAKAQHGRTCRRRQGASEG
ncbi:hypothetical protein GALL_388250 [mine drainage metagenome]|uniref:Uncharacterized protein n=1 Tax=mine drainage metagenome TaxID=410659 RepID=A0A1J5QHG1_9ZZZZ